MTIGSAQDRSHESIINDTLARLLRERLALSTAAETLREGRRPDIIVRPQQSPAIVLEIELEPALTVEADALSRLGMEIDGQPVQNVFAVTVPGPLRSLSQQHLYERMAVAQLEWQEWRIDGSCGPKLNGTVLDLGSAVTHTTPPAGNLDEAVDVLDKGVRKAGSRLYSSPGTAARVAKIFGIDPGNESANMAALVVTNAMIFQERLASAEAAYQTVSVARRNGVFSRDLLLQMWDYILSVDYYPIFSMARGVVQELSDVEAAAVLEECAQTASDLVGMGAVGRHDLAGRIFNRLVSERKLLAAFYTSIPASVLLAGLALSPSRWPNVEWGDSKQVAELRVVDPACGTGTLLMAAYRQILQNQATSGIAVNEDSTLHRALLEQIIFGADVVQAAIHLTAATLAAMSPTVRFEQMQLHTLRLGMNESKKVHLGSLEWLAVPEIQSFFSTTEEQIGATSGTGTLVARPRADLVISNPPYTRRGSNGGYEKSLARVFSLPEGDSKSQNAIKNKTSALLKGTAGNQMAGHGSSFLVLADRTVNPGGRIAFVLSISALFGQSWPDIRQMLSDRYEIEFVVSSHAPALRSMSYDTGIAEALLVARRLREGEEPSGRAVFVNLWRAAYQETDALALVKGITTAASTPILTSDGPPIGGSPLIIGGEQWGEIMNGPTGAGHWTPARWRAGLICQFATALERGELWSADSTQITGRFPVATIGEFCALGPDSQQIHKKNGPFDSYAGWNEQAQFYALMGPKESEHQSIFAEPNAWLVPKPERNYLNAWSQAGRLQLAGSIRYNSQRVLARRTDFITLGARSWYSLQVQDNEPSTVSQEMALSLWLNSTFGMLLHANRSNDSQEGRGQGNKGMLKNMVVLDVRKLEAWQLEAAQTIWRDFKDRKFQPFYQCVVDPARIALDERIVRDVLGLGEDAVDTVARLRFLMASEPSIHGSKKPELG